MRKWLQLSLCLLTAGCAISAQASVLTPGENPGQYYLEVDIYNGSELPNYPPSGLVGEGFLRYESDWLDRQIAAWTAWRDCYENGGDCDELASAIEASFDLDTITFDDMADLLVDARFEMYGVTFDETDVTEWVVTIGGGTILEVVDGENSIYFAEGEDVYHTQLRLNGHYGDNDNANCYAEEPDGSWTEEICYFMYVDPVPATVPEPGTLALLSLGFLGLGLMRHKVC
jgi:hypothetical protein